MIFWRKEVLELHSEGQQLQNKLFEGFILAATAGMVAWAILSWACVKISEHSMFADDDSI